MYIEDNRSFVLSRPFCECMCVCNEAIEHYRELQGYKCRTYTDFGFRITFGIELTHPSLAAKRFQ